MTYRAGMRWLVVVCAALTAAGWTWGKKDDAQQPAGQASASAAQTAASSESENRKVVHTFSSDEDMAGFTNIWQQRQGILARMAVLRAYWAEEQARLVELDKQLADTYHADTSKRLVLNTESRELIEREAPAETAVPTPPAAAPGS